VDSCDSGTSRRSPQRESTKPRHSDAISRTAAAPRGSSSRMTRAWTYHSCESRCSRWATTADEPEATQNTRSSVTSTAAKNPSRFTRTGGHEQGLILSRSA
jgi:hypothetical protein